jgi:hypothetical protein
LDRGSFFTPKRGDPVLLFSFYCRGLNRGPKILAAKRALTATTRFANFHGPNTLAGYTWGRARDETT